MPTWPVDSAASLCTSRPSSLASFRSSRKRGTVGRVAYVGGVASYCTASSTLLFSTYSLPQIFISFLIFTFLNSVCVCVCVSSLSVPPSLSFLLLPSLPPSLSSPCPLPVLSLSSPCPLPVLPSPLPVLPSPLPVLPSPLPVLPSPLPVLPSPFPVLPSPIILTLLGTEGILHVLMSGYWLLTSDLTSYQTTIRYPITLHTITNTHRGGGN